MKLPTVSIVLVCRNECHNIEPYFKTLEGVADELIIVDTGSSDGTLEEIARCTKTASYPVHLYDYTRDFFHDNMARQFGGEKASCDYIFQVDTDERLSDGYRTKLKQFLAEHKPEIVTIPREDELVPHLHDVMDYRFYRKGAQASYGNDLSFAVHPRLQYSAKPVLFNEPLYHMQGKNHWLRRPTRIFEQLSREVDRTENTRGFFREFIRGIAGAFYKFRKVYFRLGARKDGRAGLKFAFLKAFYTFLLHIFIGLKPRNVKYVESNH
jgi:glycosyltransferase involved in cell wall biosynthesis